MSIHAPEEADARALPLLAVRGANKRFEGEVALDDADLDLQAGEVHALMGENGAGKSTLIKLLAGVVAPDAMDLRVLGREVEVREPADASRLGMRFIHQELNVVPATSVAENVFLGQPYPRTPLGLVAWRRLRRRAGEVLARLGVHHIDPAAIAGRLPVGDAMLVSIARAFAGEDERERIFVMDEPTAALSKRETDLLFAVVRGLQARGAGVLYVSHRMEEIFEIADRITVLRDGRVVGTQLARNATRAGLIERMTGRAPGESEDPAPTPPRTDADGARPPILRARGLNTAALVEASLTLRAGEVVAVTGLAGSGRTEVLRALMAVDPLEGGALELDGRPATWRTPGDAWAAGLAYLPEERRAEGLAMRATVRRNVAMPHYGAVSTSGWVRPERERRLATRWGEAVGLRARGPDQVVHELSGGNQQKVVLARALAGGPRVLLLDEPTRGVDVGAKADIHALIRDAARDGAGVVVASSDLDEVLSVADRVLVMQAGRVAHDLPTAGLDRASLLTLCYGGSAS